MHPPANKREKVTSQPHRQDGHRNLHKRGSSHSSQNEDKKKHHIKKPLNAFMLFMKEQRAKVVAECTLKESAAINQILGQKWHAIDQSEQAKYYEMARKEKELHLQLYPGWSARDNYATHTKKKRKKKDSTDSKVPGVGLTPSKTPSKDHHLGKALVIAKRSKASICKFTGTLPKEKPSRFTGKKRKFEPNHGNIKTKTSKRLQILNNLRNQAPVLNVKQTVNSELLHEEKQRYKRKRDDGGDSFKAKKGKGGKISGPKSVPGVGLTPTETPSKDHRLGKALVMAKRSKASIGKFTGTLPKEKPSRFTGKKQKFEPNHGNIKNKTSKRLQILNNLRNQAPVLNVKQTVNSELLHEEKQRYKRKRDDGGDSFKAKKGKGGKISVGKGGKGQFKSGKGKGKKKR